MRFQPACCSTYRVDNFPPKVITRVWMVQECDHRFLFFLYVDCTILFDTNIHTILPQQHGI